MKKKALSVLLAAAMVTTIVAGCGGGGSEEPADTSANEGSSEEGSGASYDGVELTYWSMWTNTEPQGQVLQAAVDAWSEETGATVTIEWKGRDIKNILGSALESE